LHAGETWSFEIAVDYIDRIGLQPRDHAESEVKRYLGWPGQAISYKVGEREILDIRGRGGPPRRPRMRRDDGAVHRPIPRLVERGHRRGLSGLQGRYRFPPRKSTSIRPRN